MAISAAGASGTPVVSSAIPTSSPAKPDHERILAGVKAQLGDGVFDRQDLDSLRATIAKELFGAETDPAALKPDQLSQVDALLADALDGKIDQQTGVSNAKDVVATLAKVEKAGFSPVGFAIPESVTGESASGQAVQFSTPDLIDKLMNSNQPDKAANGSKMLQELCSGFASASPAQQIETLAIVLRSGTPAQRYALRDQATPEILGRMLESLGPDKLVSTEAAAISALICDKGSPELIASLGKKLEGLSDPEQVANFYNSVGDAIGNFQLTNAPRSTADQGFGVGRRLAEAHFAKLPAATQFKVLMKVRDTDGDRLLRPLIRSVDDQPEKKAEIRRLAQGICDDYERHMTKLGAVSTGQAPTLAPGAYVAPEDYGVVVSADKERAKLILKILDEPGDTTGPDQTAKPAPKTEPKPVTKPDPKPITKPDPSPVKPETVDINVPEPPPDKPVVKDFSTQTFLERMARYREQRDLDKLVEGLDEADQLKLVRLLDQASEGKLEKPAGTSEQLPIPDAKLAKETIQALMPKLHALTPAARGEITARLLDSSPDQAMSLIRQARKEGKLAELVANLRIDGVDQSARIPKHLSNDDAGKVLAWMVTDEGTDRANAGQIDKSVRELSKYLVEDDNITRSFMRELEDYVGRPGNEAKGLGIIKDHLGSDLVKKLTENLDQGWVTAQDREFMLKLAAAAGTQMGNPQVQQMLRVGDHKTALAIMAKASDADLAAMISGGDRAQLGRAFAANPAEFGKLLARLEQAKLSGGDRAGLQSQLDGLIKELPVTALKQSFEALGTPLALGDGSREAYFARFADQGDFESIKTLLRGGRGLPAADGALRGRLLDKLAAELTRIKDVPKAGEALSWVLEHGSKAQIERSFEKVAADSWFGPRKGEIVNQVMARKDALRGKLSLDTIQHMAGSLNNFSAKLGAKMPGFVRDSLGMGNFDKNVANIRALAEFGDRDAKAAILRDLMDYWTPDKSETLIHDILSDAGKKGAPGEFRQLIDAVATQGLSGPQRTSDELEERGELGRVMALVLDHYGPGADKAINDMMGRWARTSIKSDDVIWHMLKALGPDAAAKLASKLSAETLKTMIDWTDDGFRDGNVYRLDPESQWSVDTLKAALARK